MPNDGWTLVVVIVVGRNFIVVFVLLTEILAFFVITVILMNIYQFLLLTLLLEKKTFKNYVF